MIEAPKSLEKVRELSWQMLSRGAVDKKDALQILTLITHDGNRPNPRSVILRKFVPHQRLILCHTDSRAQKVKDLLAFPQLACLAWHPKHRVQLRMYGKGVIHQEGDLWKKEWERLSQTSKLNYSSELAPGSSIGNPEMGWDSYSNLDQVEEGLSPETWADHFCVIEYQIEEMDWLMLRRGKHLRAHFKWTEGKLEERWLVP